MKRFQRSAPVFIAEGGITVHATAGEIQLDARDLVEQHGDSFMDCLMDRALSMDVVHSVAIDRRRGSMTIQYDPQARELAAALADMAQIFRGESLARSPDFQVNFDRKGVPGVVTRVDRVRTVVGETTPSRKEAGWTGWVRSLGRDRCGRTSHLDSTAAILEGIIVHFSPTTPGDEVDFDGELLDRQIQPPSTALSRVPSETALAEHQDECLAQGWRRVANFAAAGGCFALSVIGFITPGIPTVPFVLATSYFLARSTPALNEQLRQSYLFGQMVRDWEDRGGVQLGTKVKTIAVMFGLLGATVLLTGPTLPILATSAVVAGVDLLVVLSLPTVPGERSDIRLLDPPVPALLTA